MWEPEHSNFLSSHEFLETKDSLSERDPHNVTDVANRNFALQIGKIS